jgi:long-chain acyl-CoA synthetase
VYPGTHALRTPDKPAILMASTGRTVTYARLDDRSLRLANWMRSVGLQRGDVIALISDNDARVFDVYWAAQRAGLYLTAVNHRLHADEIRDILENSGSKALFVGERQDPAAAPSVTSQPAGGHFSAVGSGLAHRRHRERM